MVWLRCVSSLAKDPEDLKSKGLAPDLPEEPVPPDQEGCGCQEAPGGRNRKDKDAKFRLILIESRIHRLARYYKTKRVRAPQLEV
uniref:Uncharacterized protein n=1 Tax=Sphaeramia orbicularis TaxID=375764 RepID=A0A673A809_9TELE